MPATQPNSDKPCSSRIIVGSAVDTAVWSSSEKTRPSSSPIMIKVLFVDACVIAFHQLSSILAMLHEQTDHKIRTGTPVTLDLDGMQIH